MKTEYKSILVTGGTGSFGKAFVQQVLKQLPEINRLVIFSRDEFKQHELSQQIESNGQDKLRFFLGDVRDKDRLRRAMENIDIVVHAAALKQVPTAEYNPFEFIKTNIIGAQNVVEAALDADIKRVIALSTDKAAAPINLYGATKLCADKLFIAANNIKGKRDIRLSVVRYGNVMASRGSVVPFFIQQKKTGILPITDPEMTRFTINLEDGVRMVFWAIEHAKGGEIFVPKIPSYRITDLAKAIGPECEHQIVGMRPGEKLHEEMITNVDSFNTVDLGDYYAILSQSSPLTPELYCQNMNGKKVPSGFSYNSGTNPQFLSVEQLRTLIGTIDKEHNAL